MSINGVGYTEVFAWGCTPLLLFFNDSFLADTSGQLGLASQKPGINYNGLDMSNFCQEKNILNHDFAHSIS